MWRFLLDDLRERPGCVLETKAQLSVSRITKKLASAPAQYISFRMFLQTKVWAQKLLGITRLIHDPNIQGQNDPASLTATSLREIERGGLHTPRHAEVGCSHGLFRQCGQAAQAFQPQMHLYDLPGAVVPLVADGVS
jgi:hypothetical protein